MGDPSRQIAVIRKARFDMANDYPLGLHLELKLEGGMGVGWSICERDEIGQFMNKLKTTKIEGLVGKVIVAVSDGPRIVDIEFNDNLIV